MPKENHINLTNAKLLIVDDIPENLRVIGALLSTVKYKIAVAKDGESAISTAKIFLPDLILMDINMPGLNGLEACKRLKDDDDTKHIPIIFVTAKSQEEDIIKGFEVGGMDYITKPFRAGELLKRVETHLLLKFSNDIITKQNKELIEINAQKDKLFSIISHDLKSPIAGTIGLSDFMVNKPDNYSKEDFVDMLEDINLSNKRQLELIENLLDWSRIQTGRMTFRLDVVPIGAIISEIINLIKHNCSQKGITIENNVHYDMQIVADEFMMHTIFRNLISNAIKFSNNNGKIIINGFEDNINQSFVFTVTDNGIGLSDKEIEQLFVPSKTIVKKGTNQEKGTGLGLILCKEFVDFHNGKIKVDSKPNESTQFRINIPMN